jgi:hypothetical protein
LKDDIIKKPISTGGIGGRYGNYGNHRFKSRPQSSCGHTLSTVTPTCIIEKEYLNKAAKMTKRKTEFIRKTPDFQT